MESLIREKHTFLIKSLLTLQEALKLLDNPAYQQIYKSLRDSAIQRFEYTIDIFWKFLKVYMQEELNVSLDSNTPRFVLREAVHAQLINEEEAELFIAGIADRNLTSHTYQEHVAEQIIHQIPSYYTAMKTVTDRILL